MCGPAVGLDLGLSAAWRGASGVVGKGEHSFEIPGHAVAANDLSRRTEQQASSLEESSAALNEITSRVTKTADGAREASASVAAARQISEKRIEIARNARPRR